MRDKDTPLLSTDKITNITSDDVTGVFQGSKDRLINIGVLEQIEIIFNNNSVGAMFHRNARAAFKISDYRQLTSGVLL